MNKSLNRVNANGCVYSPEDAQAVVEQWKEISKGLVDKDLRSVQRDITTKINNRQLIPDEFLNSREVAYRVAGVVTAELMNRKAKLQDTHLQDIRRGYEARRKSTR
jgi:hypothetical protein